jgi:hypothetical protein
MGLGFKYEVDDVYIASFLSRSLEYAINPALNLETERISRSLLQGGDQADSI